MRRRPSEATATPVHILRSGPPPGGWRRRKKNDKLCPKRMAKYDWWFQELASTKMLYFTNRFFAFLRFLKVEITNEKISGFNTRRAGPGFHYLNLGVLTQWFKVPS